MSFLSLWLIKFSVAQRLQGMEFFLNALRLPFHPAQKGDVTLLHLAMSDALGCCLRFSFHVERARVRPHLVTLILMHFILPLMFQPNHIQSNPKETDYGTSLILTFYVCLPCTHIPTLT